MDTAVMRTVSETLRHRGPDDHGYLGWSGGSSATVTRRAEELEGSLLMLAHRRLTILELSEAGWQPMGTPDGRHFIVYNGEIYNYLEIKRELEAEGVPCHSNSDTEVLLKALVHKGLDILPRLIGMFAFCYVDLERERLFLVRDFFGIKPLYYTVTDTSLCFASEIKGMLRFPGVGREVNARQLFEYLQFGLVDHSEETMVAGVRRLPAAHILEVPLRNGAAPELRRYWRVPLDTTLDLSFSEAVVKVRELFLENVGLHLRSDVPVGAALSGGVDSSAIVMTMRHLRGEDIEIHSFSQIPDEPAISEEKWIDLVAQRGGITSHKVVPTPAEFFDELDRYVYSNDEPFGWFNGYAQYRFFRLTHETGIKVSLDGQGSDELFAGYALYVRARFRSLVREGRLLEGRRFLGAVAAEGGVMSPLRYAKAVAGLLAEPLRRPLQRRREWGRWNPQLNAKWFLERGVPRGHAPVDDRAMGFRELLHDSFVRSSLPRLLRCEDRTSMAHSVESRVPFLTPKLVEFVFSLPEAYLIDGQGTRKAVLRAALDGIAPDEIMNRRDKIACATPNWFEREPGRARAIVERNRALALPAFRQDEVEKYWEALRAGRTSDYRLAWRLVNTLRWAQVFEVSFP